MAFWNRKKRNAIEGWQSETVSTDITMGPFSATVSSDTKLTIGDEEYDPANPEHREALEAAEAMLGKDLDGDGQVTERPPPGVEVFPVTGGADPIELLERAQKLREAGALTDAEFEAQKRRLLDTDIS